MLTQSKAHGIMISSEINSRYVAKATSEISGSVVNSVNSWKQDIKNTDAYECGIKIVPDKVAADEGEIPVKQYENVARLRSRTILIWAEGKM